MALYGYYGNHDEIRNATARIRAASGNIDIGQVGDLTAQEAATLISKGLDIRPVGSATPVRTNFNTFVFKRPA